MVFDVDVPPFEGTTQMEKMRKLSSIIERIILIMLTLQTIGRSDYRFFIIKLTVIWPNLLYRSLIQSIRLWIISFKMPEKGELYKYLLSFTQ